MLTYTTLGQEVTESNIIKGKIQHDKTFAAAVATADNLI